MRYFCLFLIVIIAVASSQGNDPRCSLPLDAGLCSGNFERYGFNKDNCEQFVYGGCQGNENRFETLEECEAVCQA